MITIPAIFKDGAAYPESMPDLKFGNYFDGVNYYYFENDQEIEAWKLAQENQPQIPIEDEFFKAENIEKLWEKLLDNISPAQVAKLKQKLK